jgi:hypothetical protein
MNKGIQMLISSTIYFELFKTRIPEFSFGYKKRSRLDFVFELLSPFKEKSGMMYRKILRGDASTSKGLDVAWDAFNAEHNSSIEIRPILMLNFIKQSKMILDFTLLSGKLDQLRLSMKCKESISSISDLKIDGNKIMEILNIPPSVKIKNILEFLAQRVLDFRIRNTESDLINEVKEIEDLNVF